MTALAPTLQAFFTDRLTRQKNASPHTITAYRDTLRLFLGFAWQRTGTPPSRLGIEDLDARLVAAFLDHLEHDRGNSARSRNARLAAIHSLFSFAALQHPEHAGQIARVLAIPPNLDSREGGRGLWVLCCRPVRAGSALLREASGPLGDTEFNTLW
jgi:integrase/recombinase XerD